MTTTRPSPVVSMMFREWVLPSTDLGRKPAAACSSGQRRNLPGKEPRKMLLPRLAASLPTSCLGIRVRPDRVGRRRRLDVHIHLLADVQRRILAFHAIDDLKNAGIHTFGALARQRLLGNDVRLEAHELERNFERPVAAWGADGRRASLYSRGVFFIHVYANIQGGNTAENH